MHDALDQIVEEIVNLDELITAELQRSQNEWLACVRTRLAAVANCLEGVSDPYLQKGLAAQVKTLHEEIIILEDRGVRDPDSQEKNRLVQLFKDMHNTIESRCSRS